PDTNFTRPGPPQYPGTGAGRGARGENVVHEHEPLAVESLARPHGKGMAHIGYALRAGETGLRQRRANPLDQPFVNWDARGAAEPLAQALGLVELALAVFGGMQGDGH